MRATTVASAPIRPALEPHMNPCTEPRLASLPAGQRLAAAAAAVLAATLLLGSVVAGLTSRTDDVPRLAGAASGPRG
jgi:hypothetical protein